MEQQKFLNVRLNDIVLLKKKSSYISENILICKLAENDLKHGKPT
jgi:hypothetical protein